MDILEKPLQFPFKRKSEAESFLKELRDEAYKYDVVTINDVLLIRGERSIPEGYKYGYHRDELKKLKAKPGMEGWTVELPLPGRMIRDRNGYWTTENILKMEELQSGGDG